MASNTGRGTRAVRRVGPVSALLAALTLALSTPVFAAGGNHTGARGVTVLATSSAANDEMVVALSIVLLGVLLLIAAQVNPLRLRSAPLRKRPQRHSAND